MKLKGLEVVYSIRPQRSRHTYAMSVANGAKYRNHILWIDFLFVWLVLWINTKQFSQQVDWCLAHMLAAKSDVSET